MFQTLNDSRASKLRLAKYIIPVVAFAFVFNLPKFFESEVKSDFFNGTDSVEQKLYVDITW